VDAGAVTRWDLDAGRLVARYDHATWSHDPDHYHGREILFSPAGRWLAHDVYEGRVYDVETGRVVSNYAERWPDRNYAAHGGRVAAGVRGEVKTFDALTGGEVGTFPATVGPGRMSRTAFTFSPDGTHALYFTDRWVVVDAATARQLGLGNAFD